jgi:outer membrane protein OmpA-like peptidoglycan-associated protein
MLRLTAFILTGAWLFMVPAIAQDQDGEPVGESVEQSPAGDLEPSVPPEIVEFLQDQRPVSEFSDEELGRRSKQAREFARLKGLSPQLRDDLQTISEQLRAERQARMAAKQDTQTSESPVPEPGATEQPAAESTAQEPVEAPKAESSIPADVTEFLSDKRPVSGLSLEEIGQRSRKARQLLAIQGLDPAVKRQLRDVARQLQSERAARQNSPEASGGSEQAEVQPEPSTPTGDAEKQAQTEPTETPVEVAAAPPEIQNKAREIIADDVSAERLSDEQLSNRLRDMRAVLEEPGLSKKEQRALRKKLKAEREVLRSRMANAQPEAEAPKPGAEPVPGAPRDETRMDMNWQASEALRDRRSPDALQKGQLRRRMAVYRDAMGSDQYAQEERDLWRSGYERDRRELRRRMVDERREREAYWGEQRRGGKLEIDINVGVGQGGLPPEEIWADEVDDEEIEDQLLAAPRRQVQRRYSIEDFEEEPELREVMPGVEIDTIRFGFNEAFVREEEIGNLDRIAEAVEKILAARPGEVFLIEGHTDAVGSDTYNLKLSRQRAQAVKEALITYYVIPADNLETIGYGERYLKIPTDEPEQENRRVGLRRVTPLVGELDD